MLNQGSELQQVQAFLLEKFYNDSKGRDQIIADADPVFFTQKTLEYQAEFLLKSRGSILEIQNYCFLRVGIAHTLGISPEELQERIEHFLPDEIVILDSNYRIQILLLALRCTYSFEVEVLEQKNSLEYISKLKNLEREANKFEQFKQQEAKNSPEANWLQTKRERSLENIKTQYWVELHRKLRLARTYRGDYLPINYFEHMSPTLVVDSREQKTTLLTTLYQRGFIIDFIALASADYLVSGEFGIERKNIGDLLQSLRNGRLENQLGRMKREFQEIGLLVENESQSWAEGESPLEQPSFFIVGDLKNKFNRLLRKYESLKLMKSHCPSHSASILLGLKQEKGGLFRNVVYRKQPKQ